MIIPRKNQAKVSINHLARCWQHPAENVYFKILAFFPHLRAKEGNYNTSSGRYFLCSHSKSALCDITKDQFIELCLKVTLSKKSNKLAKQEAVLIPGYFTDRVETRTAINVY